MDWKALVMSISVIALSSNPKTKGIVPYVGPAIAATEDLIKKIPGESKADRNKRKLANAVALVKTSIKVNNELQAGTAHDVSEPVADHLIESAISVVVDSANLIHKSPLATSPEA